MKNIYRGGLLSRAKGKLFINCATVTPAIHVWVEQKCEAKGAQSLEACMASSITQAREGSLYLMCGGKPEAFERAKPILEKLSASLRYLGPAGKAAEVKALVNMVMNCNTAALAEGLGLGAALGLDLTTVARGVRPDGRQFVRVADGWRGHAKPRAHVLFLRRARRQGFGYRAQAGQGPGIEPPACPRHQRNNTTG